MHNTPKFLKHCKAFLEQWTNLHDGGSKRGSVRGWREEKREEEGGREGVEGSRKKRHKEKGGNVLKVPIRAGSSPHR